MAEHGKVEYATATGNDYAEHEGTYDKVMRLAKVGTVVVLAVVVALGIHGTTDSMFWVAFGLIAAIFVALPYGLYRDTVVPAASLLVLLLIVWALLV